MTNRILASMIVVGLFTVMLPNARAQDDPMDVFKPLVGTWTTTSENRPSLANPKPSKGTGELTVKMTLNGRFLQSDGYAAAPGIGRQDFHLLMTYDDRQQTYRRWVFRSDGVVAESTGVWNADTKTMTWPTLGLPANVTFTITTEILEDGFRETLSGRRADGTVTMDVTYTSEKKS